MIIICRRLASPIHFYPAIDIFSQIDIVHKGIPDGIQAVVYRVLQEALNNIGKHSAATKVCVDMTTHEGQIRLKIADNGAERKVK